MAVVYGISIFIDTDELALVSGSGGWIKDDAAAYAEGLPLLQLYDMQADPGEQNNLCGQDLDQVKKMVMQLERLFEKVVIRQTHEMGPREIKMTGDVEARLIALCCSPVPEGYARWTVRLLADKMVELNYIDDISPMTVSRTLKKRIQASLETMLDHSRSA